MTGCSNDGCRETKGVGDVKEKSDVPFSECFRPPCIRDNCKMIIDEIMSKVIHAHMADKLDPHEGRLHV